MGNDVLISFSKVWNFGKASDVPSLKDRNSDGLRDTDHGCNFYYILFPSTFIPSADWLFRVTNIDMSFQ